MKIFKPYQFKHGEMPCFLCHNEPVFVKSRKLGQKCYRRLRENEKLPPKPKKSSFEIKKTFSNNLVRKYGNGILGDFNLLHLKPFWNLTEIAKKYGFTRERSRQIYKMIYSKGYTKTKVAKGKRVAEETNYCKNDPRHKVAEYKRGSLQAKGACAELLFYNKCKELEYNIELLCDIAIDIKINGHFVEIKSSYSSFRTGNGGPPYWRFRLTKNQKECADIIACYHGGRNLFFIIPITAVPVGNTIYIPSEPSSYHNAINKYEPYQEAWHLLE